MQPATETAAWLVDQGSFPDPFVFRTDDGWMAIGTGPAGDGRMFPTMVSHDWFHWRRGPGALEIPNVQGTAFWAPEVMRWGDRWRLFYSVGHGDLGHQLRVAEACSPGGPYVDLGGPVLDPAGCGFAIDAHPYQHWDGSMWLFYARDFLDGDRPGTGLAVAPLVDGRRIGDDYQLVARATMDWQTYERNRLRNGIRSHWHTLEGPSTVVRDGLIWLFYSGGNWTNSTYGVDWVIATHPLGPWHDDQAPAPRLLRTAGPWHGPGHNSYVEGPDGQVWTAFHAWDEAHTVRRMWLAELIWKDGKPRLV